MGRKTYAFTDLNTYTVKKNHLYRYAAVKTGDKIFSFFLQIETAVYWIVYLEKIE